MPEKKILTPLQKTVNILLLIAAAIAPLKFGVMLLPGIPNALPGSLWEILLNAFPPAFFAFYAGIMLVLTLCAYGFPLKISWKDDCFRLLLTYLALPLVTLIGFIDADSLESPIVELEYTLSLSAMAATVALVIKANDSGFVRKLLGMICIGTVLTALWGAHQYFFGFAEMREFLAEEERKGTFIPPEIKARALDVRTYATFTFASALAAMFCLGGALTLCRAHQCGSRFEPQNISQKIFAGSALLLCGGIFLTTRGRGAFLAVIAAAAVCGFIKLKSGKLKLAVAAGTLLLIVAGAFYIHYAGRGFGSMTERVSYLKSSAQMLVNHPLTGDGWGDFAFHHSRHKDMGNEELAKDPHNIVAAFAGQCGIAGGLLISWLLLYTLYGAYKNLRRDFSYERMSIFFGLTAFSIHALMDLDWQVPALMFWYMILSFAAFYKAEPAEDNDDDGRSHRLIGCIALSVVAAVALLGSLHWLAADNAYSNFLQAAGQTPGAAQAAQSRLTVDAYAQKTLKLMPYSHSVYIAWGNDAMRRGDYATALKRYQTAQKMVPRSHAIYKSMGDACERMGDTAQSAVYFRKADELFPLKKAIYDQRKQQKSTAEQ